jgi:hypothetical protein
MYDELQPKDPGAVWRDQPEERLPVNPVEFVNRRTRELYSSTRAEILGSIAAALLFAGVLASRFAFPYYRVPRYGLIAVVIWVLISLYRFRDQIRGKDAPRKDALAAPGVEYYRKELERRRDHLRNAWIWHGPLVVAGLTLAAVVTGNVYSGVRNLESVVPLLVLLVAWTGYNVRRRWQQAAELQREIDEIGRSEGSRTS